MTWVSDIFSAIGPGTVGAAAAAAVYAGASATDKEARKEAKHDIAMFLIGFHTKFELSLISRHISHAFEIIFGPRHFSARCILRSILTTFVFSTVALAMIHLKHSPDIIGLAGSVSFTSNPRFNQWIGEGVIYTMLVGLACIIPDYLSLWKSRILLRWLHLKPKIWHLLV